MSMLGLLYKLRSTPAPAVTPGPRPALKLVWSAPSILGEFPLAPAPPTVDGVTVVTCRTYAEPRRRLPR